MSCWASGVGKTSIVKSVAESMNREYSMRLGGVTSESEIRSHRKTYVGAMPGRIISSLPKSRYFKSEEYFLWMK